MSEQERDVHAKRSEDPEAEDVEAHVKSKAANIEGDDDGDDVEAHVKAKAANAEDDGGDDVEAHVATR